MLGGVASGEVLADASNDPTGAVRDDERFVGVSGSTIQIRIRDLLSNDTGKNKRFIRAFKIAGDINRGGVNPSSAGIRAIRRNGGVLLIKLANNFRGHTSFKYEINAFERGRNVRSRANVFIRVRRPSTPS